PEIRSTRIGPPYAGASVVATNTSTVPTANQFRTLSMASHSKCTMVVEKNALSHGDQYHYSLAASHSLTVPLPSQDASILAVGEKAMGQLVSPDCLKVKSSCPSLIFKRDISLPAVASVLPSGENATVRTGSVRVMRRFGFPVSRSHRITRLSLPPDARTLAAGEKAKPYTSSAWPPVNLRSSAPEPTSQSSTSPINPRASVLPSGENAKDLT